MKISKTFNIGEYAKGGVIITMVTNNNNLQKKNKDGIVNYIFLIGACLIVIGAIIGFSDFPNNTGKGGGLCFIGTVLTLVSGYIKYGYFKFFN